MTTAPVSGRFEKQAFWRTLRRIIGRMAANLRIFSSRVRHRLGSESSRVLRVQ
jgi:hypothetical protein